MGGLLISIVVKVYQKEALKDNKKGGSKEPPLDALLLLSLS
jgi:hypothetical protein